MKNNGIFLHKEKNYIIEFLTVTYSELGTEVIVFYNKRVRRRHSHLYGLLFSSTKSFKKYLKEFEFIGVL